MRTSYTHCLRASSGTKARAVCSRRVGQRFVNSFQAHKQARKNFLSSEDGSAAKFCTSFRACSISASTSERRKRSVRLPSSPPIRIGGANRSRDRLLSTVIFTLMQNVGTLASVCPIDRGEIHGLRRSSAHLPIPICRRQRFPSALSVRGFSNRDLRENRAPLLRMTPASLTVRHPKRG
jgi:hypothetical protein